MASDKQDFTQQAQRRRGGLVGEYLGFLKTSKKLYLIPIIVFLLLIGLIIVLSGSVAAPLIYTLF